MAPWPPDGFIRRERRWMLASWGDCVSEQQSSIRAFDEKDPDRVTVFLIVRFRGNGSASSSPMLRKFAGEGDSPSGVL
jgi:hypothetical protein